MHPELENKLYEKYPKIFRQKDWTMDRTAMCWGINCGNGWYDLIDRLCDAIQLYVDSRINNAQWESSKTGNEFNPQSIQVEAAQVKEKYGTLRFYVDNADEFVNGLIYMASCMSINTCIDCGSNHNIKTTPGWIQPLCDDCYAVWELSNVKKTIED